MTLATVYFYKPQRWKASRTINHNRQTAYLYAFIIVGRRVRKCLEILSAA
jgi:hypothetical protein